MSVPCSSAGFDGMLAMVLVHRACAYLSRNCSCFSSPENCYRRAWFLRNRRVYYVRHRHTRALRNAAHVSSDRSRQYRFVDLHSYSPALLSWGPSDGGQGSEGHGSSLRGMVEENVSACCDCKTRPWILFLCKTATVRIARQPNCANTQFPRYFFCTPNFSIGHILNRPQRFENTGRCRSADCFR